MHNHVLAISSVFLLSACAQGRIDGRYEHTKTTTHPDGTTVEENITSDGRSQLPKNVESHEGMTIGPDGVITKAQKTWKLDEILGSSWIFFVLAGLCIIAAALLVWLKQYMLAILILSAGILIGVMPYVIKILGPLIAVLFGVLLVAGVFYFIGKYIFRVELFRRNMPGVVKLRGEGRLAEADAIVRAIDRNVDEATKKAKAALRTVTNGGATKGS